jgi:hypothetical protein
MGEETTRLSRVLALIRERGWKWKYSEEDGCGSIDFEYRGVPYHIWEFRDGEWGVETNLRHGGRQEEILGDYESEMLKIMKDWY